MRNTVINALECWASRPTWFSSHPSDAIELRKAISNLKKISPLPTISELIEAITHHVEDAPTMPGTPKNIDTAVNEFAHKIVSKL
ncbi:hypothetical protein [Yersinia aldovae]|uniref:hypothetical protein n=1 Tax=Yersinia aldovae TaxID=29483 RepID=UPI0005ACB40F|nr:hypothetical protein [Yersinia aldovae]AJJ64685.1 hypothetical protein AT01_766 [Yersinia aldovae 670-83]